MLNRNRWIGGAAALVVAGIAAWALSWFGDDKYSDDPAVAELQQLRDEQFAHPSQISETEQTAARDAFRGRMQGLSDEQRQAFFESSMPMFMKMMQAQVERFLAMPPKEQLAEIDHRIDEMQARSGGPPGGGGGFGSQPSPQRMDQMRKRMLDASSPEQRAKMERAMAIFQKRLEERGVSPGPGGGFF